MDSDLASIRHYLAEEIQLLTTLKDQSLDETEYRQLTALLNQKKQQFENILEAELNQNSEQYQKALAKLQASVDAAKLVLQKLKPMSATLKLATSTLRAVETILKIVT